MTKTRAARKLPRRAPLPMLPDIRDMWWLAMYSDEFNRLNRSDYQPTQNRLRDNDGYSAVGVLCDLYSRTYGEDHWVLTSIGWEWDGVYLGECPPEVVIWAFQLENLGMSRNRLDATVKELRKVLFEFDEYCDSKKRFPKESELRRVF